LKGRDAGVFTPASKMAAPGQSICLKIRLTQGFRGGYKSPLTGFSPLQTFYQGTYMNKTELIDQIATWMPSRLATA
jgi:hypothetical protein